MNIEQPNQFTKDTDDSTDLISVARLHQQAFDIVALAASANGINAIIQILSQLPPSFPVPIVVVQHLSPNYPSYLPQIFDCRTLLKVKSAEDGEKLNPSTVYVAPPNYHLLAKPDGTLALNQTPKVHFVRPSADILFDSVAESYRERAIAVVLTGADMDGSNGVRSIKKMGGKVIAQDKNTSTIFGMPAAAIETGCVDFILPLGEIAAAIANLVMKGAIV
ncbi:MAG TPA: chemotaxis protein CheB [Leptolyngbyaceae cyanobacterium]